MIDIVLSVVFVTRAKVGLDTPSSTPRALASPLVKAVLPIPSPPKRAITSVPWSFFAIFSPICSVSSAL